MIDAGLTAIEAFHSDHDSPTTDHYLALAERHGILVSGGSDYHGEKERRRAAFGTVGLPPDRFERLKAQRQEGELMAAALLTAFVASVAGIGAAIYLGLTSTQHRRCSRSTSPSASSAR